MKRLILLLFCVICLGYSYYCSAEEDLYIDMDESKDMVEASNIDKEDVKKQKTEKNKYQYDIEIYPYISVKYTYTTVVEEDF